jgi:hypothetical protein
MVDQFSWSINVTSESGSFFTKSVMILFVCEVFSNHGDCHDYNDRDTND